MSFYDLPKIDPRDDERYKMRLELRTMFLAWVDTARPTYGELVAAVAELNTMVGQWLLKDEIDEVKNDSSRPG